MGEQLTPGWYTREAGGRSYWTGTEWVVPSPHEPDDSVLTPQLTGGHASDPRLQRRRRWFAAVGVVVVALLAAGAFWWFALRSPTPAPDDLLASSSPSSNADVTPSPSADVESPEPTEPAVDDSAAIQVLSLTLGALFGMIENPNAETCSYVALVGDQFGTATPADSYRGRYEQVANYMTLSAQLCGTVEGQDLAISARRTAVEVLDENGGDWGEFDEPVPAL